MLVQTEDGDERLVPVPDSATDSLVGARVLLANDYDWVVAIEPTDPSEQVVIDLGDGSREVKVDLRPAPGSSDQQSAEVYRGFVDRLTRARRRTRPRHYVG